MTTEKEIQEMTESIEKNGWNTWAKYVLMSLEELKNQHSQSESKIDSNKDAYIQAIATLELNISKEIGALRSEVSILKTRFAVRAVAWSSIIPAITAAVLLLLKFLA